MPKKDWIDELVSLGVLWMHDGNPKRPHPELRSGKHSDGFFNLTRLIEHPRILSEACLDLSLSWNRREQPTAIFGSAFGAITIAHELANLMDVRFGFTEPVIKENQKQMVLNRFSVTADDMILVVEDVLTTGGTTEKTIAALEGAGATVLPYVLVIVNRSGLAILGERKVIALVERTVSTWVPQECPLCQQGSEALGAKGNWDKLTAEYPTE